MKISMDYKQSLKNLKKISEINLDKVDSYKEINRLLQMTIIPFNMLTLKKGKYLYRARRNNKTESFVKKDQISYITESSKIKSFGRANEPGQSIFYCSHKSETALFETSSLFYGKEIQIDSERITLGKWYVNKNIELLGIISDKKVMAIDPSLYSLFEKSLKHPLSDQYTQIILEFFSQEFSKNVLGATNQYKISCAYFNHIIKMFNNERLMGVVYPSVENEYRDLNVALLPKAVDESLILEMVAEFEVDTNKMTISQVSLADINTFDQKRIEI
jgi:hypothetical protein